MLTERSGNVQGNASMSIPPQSQSEENAEPGVEIALWRVASRRIADGRTAARRAANRRTAAGESSRKKNGRQGNPGDLQAGDCKQEP
jgi:hypothetical protein